MHVVVMGIKQITPPEIQYRTSLHCVFRVFMTETFTNLVPKNSSHFLTYMYLDDEVVRVYISKVELDFLA